MNIHILAGGPVTCYPDLLQYTKNNTIWAAADRGVYHLLQQGIVPHAAFGDYDSVTEEELGWMKEKTKQLQIAPKEKDETDLELAINWALQQRPKHIRIFGATGGRLDHAFANVQMLIKGLEAQIPMTIVDKQNEIFVAKPGSYTIESSPYFRYISFLPMTEAVHGMTLLHFKYPLEKASVSWGSTLCVSNELVEEKGTFSFESGILMVVRSKD